MRAKRHRVSSTSGDTVYHGGRSKLRRGKAYAKGPHLRYIMKQRGYDGRVYTDEEITAAARLLRLELTLGREWFSRNDWRRVSASDLSQQWQSYYGRMLGEALDGAEGAIMTDDIEARILNVAATEGEGKAAYLCWMAISNLGWEQARDKFTRRTWYRHLKVLRSAGLGDADISAGQVVPLRRVDLQAAAVHNWSELLRVA